MIETIMLIGLGFSAATLIAFLLAPPIWRRAVRITTKKIQSQSPLTMAEIQAERDQMQAEFAQTTRRLEVTIADLKQKTVDQAVMISRGSAEADVLASKLAERSEALKVAEDELVRLTRDQKPLRDDLAALRKKVAEQDELLDQLSRRNEDLSTTLAERDKAFREQAKALARLEKENRKLRQRSVAPRAKAGKKGKAAAIDPVLDELSKKTDRLAVLAERLPERLIELKHHEDRLYAEKLSLDDQRIISHEDAARHKEAIGEYQAERDRLRQDIADVHAEITALEDDIAKSDTLWQQANSSPFVALQECLQGVGEVMSGISGTLEGEFSPEEIDTDAEISEPVRIVRTANGENTEEIAEIDATEPRRHQSRSGSLADRIRALQDQINQ